LISLIIWSVTVMLTSGTVMLTIAGTIMAILFAKQTRLGCREGRNGSQ
jgi:hypothetical protein